MGWHSQPRRPDGRGSSISDDWDEDSEFVVPNPNDAYTRQHYQATHSACPPPPSHVQHNTVTGLPTCISSNPLIEEPLGALFERLEYRFMCLQETSYGRKSAEGAKALPQLTLNLTTIRNIILMVLRAHLRLKEAIEAVLRPHGRDKDEALYGAKDAIVDGFYQFRQMREQLEACSKQPNVWNGPMKALFTMIADFRVSKTSPGVVAIENKALVEEHAYATHTLLASLGALFGVETKWRSNQGTTMEKVKEDEKNALQYIEWHFCALGKFLVLLKEHREGQRASSPGDELQALLRSERPSLKAASKLLGSHQQTCLKLVGEMRDHLMAPATQYHTYNNAVYPGAGHFDVQAPRVPGPAVVYPVLFTGFVPVVVPGFIYEN